MDINNAGMIKRLFKLRHSLSAKLLGLFIIMAFLLAVITISNIAISFKNNFQENVSPHLIQYLAYIQSDIGSPPDIEKAKAIAKKLPVDITIISDTINWSSNNLSVDLSAIKYYKKANKKNMRYKIGHDDNFEYLVFQQLPAHLSSQLSSQLPSQLTNQSSQTLIFTIPRSHKVFGIKHLIHVSLILLIMVIFYYLIRKTFQPIQTIEKGVKLIGKGNLKHRIAINRKDELGDLALNINSMADEISNMLEAKRQLLLAISHEIRSPVTRAKLAAEMLDDSQFKDSIQLDLNEIETLTEEILETEKLHSKHRALNKQPANFNQLLKETIEQHFSKNELQLQLKKTTEIKIDVIRIKLLIKNLIDNAIQHNKQDARPLLIISQKNNRISFSVNDFGDGIEAEHLPYLTEPFYRADPSRKRDTGGYGLGLYLCKMITEAHNGKLSIESQRFTGTIVKIELPIDSITPK